MVLKTHLEPFRETVKVPPVGQPKNFFFCFFCFVSIVYDIGMLCFSDCVLDAYKEFRRKTYEISPFL